MANVNVELQFVELADNKDDKISAGESFQVDVSFVPDTADTAVIGGGIDLVFDSNLLTADTIIYDEDFNDSSKNSGQNPLNTSNTGELNEVNAYHKDSPLPGQIPSDVIPAPDGNLLFSVQFTAKGDLNVAQLSLTANQGEDQQSTILTQGVVQGQGGQGPTLSQTQAQPATNVNYGSLTIDAAVSVSSPTVTITATDTQASEQGSDTGLFTISRTGDTSNALTANFTVTGTATEIDDYAAIGTSVEILAGATEATVPIAPVDDTLQEGHETIILTLVDGSNYDLGTSTSATVTIADNDTTTQPPAPSVNTVFNDGKLVYDTTSVAANTQVTAKLSDNVLDLGTDAVFDNLVGFYEVTDLNGGIDTNGDAQADLLPGNAGYALAAINGRIEAFAEEGIRAGSSGDPAKNTTVEQIGDVILAGGKFYAPFVIANGGSVGFQGFIDLENGESDGQFNEAATEFDDLVAYFSFIGANPDGVAHIQDRGNNIYGFEDLPSNLGVSDNDFNDAVFRFDFTV